MPQLDGTGPSKKGPLTGRGQGYCIVPLKTPEEELDYLKKREKTLSGQLDEVRDRIKALETLACQSVK